MKKLVYIIFLILFVILILGINLFLNNQQSTDTSLNIEEPSKNEITIIDTEPINQENNSNGESIEELSNVVEIDEEAFNEAILNNSRKALVDFYADWCGPCHVMSPILDEVAGEYTDIKFYRVNVDVEENLSYSNRIMYLPTLILFEDGEEIDRSIGQISKSELIDFIQQENPQKD